MLFSKKKKIAAYLQRIPDGEKTAFDLLLADYLDGTLKNRLESMGITKLEIHIDWLLGYKSICLQGRYQQYYMDAGIDAEEYFVEFDLDEPDGEETYPLESREAVYQRISGMILALE
jgi:hypothetical protein